MYGFLSKTLEPETLEGQLRLRL